MQNLFRVVLLLFTSALSAGGKYVRSMQKAIPYWREGKRTEASNLFERIKSAEMQNWLPYYYIVQVNTVSSFGEQDKEIDPSIGKGPRLY